MGLTGVRWNISFWLGLYQDLNDPEYQEPGDEAQNYAGWKWVNGQIFKRYAIQIGGQTNQMMLEHMNTHGSI